VSETVRRRASVQFNFRLEPEAAEVVRAAFPRGDLTVTVARLLLAEAHARLAVQGRLDEEEVTTAA